MINDNLSISHISFDEMSEYIFSETVPSNFVSIAARINKHIMNCPECGKMYFALMTLNKETKKIASYESLSRRVKTKIISFLYASEGSDSLETAVKECMNFKMWLSFVIEKNMKEFVQINQGNFAYPKRTTAMKSYSDNQSAKESEGIIKTSLYDRKGNKVSIGLDGTLSLYFDSTEYVRGKRVIIVPDDEEETPQMLELTRYDDSIFFVRFEGIKPGQYTVLIEE